jgi:predicted TIM-barrel fold metal-dependent hydrolase
MHRRRFLETATSVLIAGSHARAGATTGAVPVVDAHLHCFAGKDDPRFPYHPGGPYRPDRAATPEHLLKCMAEAGVDHAIVVHPEPYQDDHRYLEYCLDLGKGKLKGTCLYFAERAGATSRMAELVQRRPGQIVAARIHAYAPGRLPPFGKPELRSFWKAAGDLGLALQLHFEPRYAPGFEPLIREFPAISVIIDHLGRPMQAAPEEYAVVRGWSQLPNTVMKLSSIPPKEQYPHRDVGLIVRDLTERFGADRLIYGGGFGPDATGPSYRASREQLRVYLAHLTAGDQAKILGGTAARLFGFTAS